VTGGEVAAAVLQRNAMAASMSVAARVIASGYIIFVIAVCRAKEAESRRVKYCEIIADSLSKSGWSWSCVSSVDSNGRTIFVADAHRDDGKRFVVRADEKLTAFVELESAIRTTAF
jgi:hypothetical protein